MVARGPKRAYCRKRTGGTRRLRARTSRSRSRSSSSRRAAAVDTTFYRNLGYTPRTALRMAREEYASDGRRRDSAYRRAWRQFVRDRRAEGW